MRKASTMVGIYRQIKRLRATQRAMWKATADNWPLDPRCDNLNREIDDLVKTAHSIEVQTKNDAAAALQMAMILTEDRPDSPACVLISSVLRYLRTVKPQIRAAAALLLSCEVAYGAAHQFAPSLEGVPLIVTFSSCV
jgi:hypothetical protein